MTLFFRGKDAFSYAFENYLDTVYKIAVHNTSCVQDAQDISQEVFLRLLQEKKSFRDAEHLKAWLIRVTVNLCHNTYRDSLREQPTDEIVCTEANEYEPDSAIEEVKKLPENYRNAIYLHYYEGYTAKQIGSILDAKESTVLTWLSRGREMLKKNLTGGFTDGY